MKNLVEPIKDKKDVEAVEKFLEKHSIRNQLIWVFLCNSGLRVSDVLNLDVENVRNRQYVEIIEKKTGKYKRFPLNDKLKSLIKKYLVERDKTYSITDDEPLFVGKKHCRLNRSQVYRFIKEACKNVGIQGNFSTSSGRMSFGYHHYQQYHDVTFLQKLFNQNSPASTKRYIGVDNEELDNLYKKFEL